MNSQHTPGPWHWTQDFPNAVDKNELVSDKGVKVLTPITGLDRHDIGIRTGPTHDARPGYGDGETEANARLIAAAPDMYEALKEILDWANDGFRVALRPDQKRRILDALAKVESK